MLGAIAGDVIGSVHEYTNTKTKDFPLIVKECFFTDDTVLTVAVADAILTGRSYEECMRTLGRCYPNADYGGSFIQWLLEDDPTPYNSWGNGSAMRVSPVGFAFDTEADVLREAEATAAVTHNHPEGIKGAQATALAILMARKGCDKEDIRTEIAQRFEYDLQRTVDTIRPVYSYDVSCQGTVPEAIIAFLDATSFEDAIRNAISLGGDADTLACITGGIAEAFYGSVPEDIADEMRKQLAPDLLEITDTFCKRYPKPLSE